MNRHQLETLARPVVGGVVVLLTLLLLIGAAIRDPKPHDIAVGLVGPAQAVDPLVQAFGQNAPGAFAFGPFGSEQDARAAIDDRSIVAALVVAADGPRLIVAGAAGEAVVGGVTGAFSQAFAAQGVTLPVEIVHGYPTGDGHGIILFFLLLATLIASVLAGAAVALGGTSPSAATTIGVLATFAVSAGIAGVLGALWLGGNYGDAGWALVGILALAAFAVSTVVAGLGRWIGAAGVGLGALVLVLLGLVSSGGPLGTQLLPDAYRAIAPWLPVAPAIEAMRGVVAFGGSGVAWPLAVLAGWVVLGIGAVRTAGLRPAPAPARVTAAVA